MNFIPMELVRVSPEGVAGFPTPCPQPPKSNKVAITIEYVMTCFVLVIITLSFFLLKIITPNSTWLAKPLDI
jgi:hypothetical protein